jgi:high-affinity iron transporter
VSGSFVITLREGFEAALVLGIVYAYLDRIGRRHHYRQVTAGALLGLLASVGLGIAVSYLSGPLLDLGPDLVGATVIFVAVAVLTWHGWWMRQHARAVASDVQRQIDAAETSRRLWVLGVIAFAAVFREGAETVLFVWGLVSEAASVSGWATAAGGAAGLVAAGLLGWTVFRGGRGLSLRRFFGVTSMVILFLAAGMFAAGLGKLEGLGFLPHTPVLWDTSSVVADHGLVGQFLSGLVGYRARPSALEVAGYAAYLAVAAGLLFRPATRWSTPRPEAA